MEQIVKERLVGMGVLLLLGVIFIPLILDGNTADLASSSQENLQLPVPATVDGVTHEMNFSDGNVRRVELPVPVAQGADVKTNTDLENTQPEAVNGAQQASQEKTSIPASGFIKDLPKSNTEDLSATASTTSEGGSISRAAVNEKNETNLKSSTSINVKPSREDLKRVSADHSSAWVVQVGSFGNQANAEKQVSELKAKGFPAFLRRYVSAENKVLFRVRVGPEKERVRAEKLAARLAKAKIKGQIVADP